MSRDGTGVIFKVFISSDVISETKQLWVVVATSYRREHDGCETLSEASSQTHSSSVSVSGMLAAWSHLNLCMLLTSEPVKPTAVQRISDLIRGLEAGLTAQEVMSQQKKTFSPEWATGLTGRWWTNRVKMFKGFSLKTVIQVWRRSTSPSNLSLTQD